MSSLDIAHVLRAKMYHYADRGFRRDFEDIVFLLKTFPNEIMAGRSSLKEEDVDTFLESDLLNSTHGAHYRRILRES